MNAGIGVATNSRNRGASEDVTDEQVFSENAEQSADSPDRNLAGIPPLPLAQRGGSAIGSTRLTLL